jgi:hypothetical protein
MLSLVGVGCKQYEEWVGRGGSIPEVSCPDAACQGARLRSRGWYRRYVGGVPRRLRRLRCPRCRVSNSPLTPPRKQRHRDHSQCRVSQPAASPTTPCARRHHGPAAGASSACTVAAKGPPALRSHRRTRRTPALPPCPYACAPSLGAPALSADSTASKVASRYAHRSSGNHAWLTPHRGQRRRRSGRRTPPT